MGKNYKIKTSLKFKTCTGAKHVEKAMWVQILAISNGRERAESKARRRNPEGRAKTLKDTFFRELN